MRRFGSAASGLTAALVLSAFAQPAAAQSANDFRLPSSGPSQAPRVQGPVDSDVPVITAPRPTPRPSASAVPSQTASPPPTTAPTATAAPRPSPTATRLPAPGRTAQPGLTAPRPVTATTLPSTPAPAPGATAQPDAPIYSTEAAVAPLPTATAPVAPTSRNWPEWLPYAAAALAGLVALLGVALVLRRRRAEAPVEVEFERPVVPAAPKAAIPPPPAPPPPAPAQASPPPPTVASVEQDGLILSLEARRMSASLVATTLSYRLTLTNRTDAPLSALAIEGDMIAAHGQLPTERQVASPDQQLELRHALAELAPGESVDFSGDMRVPLSMITPIRSGELALFIPLARFRIAAGPLVVARTFVVGEASDDAAAALRPFRLDLGPRTYSRIGQRAVG